MPSGAGPFEEEAASLRLSRTARNPHCPCDVPPCAQERHPADQGLSCYEQPVDGKFTRWSFNLSGEDASLRPGLAGSPGSDATCMLHVHAAMRAAPRGMARRAPRAGGRGRRAAGPLYVTRAELARALHALHRSAASPPPSRVVRGSTGCCAVQRPHTRCC